MKMRICLKSIAIITVTLVAIFMMAACGKKDDSNGGATVGCGGNEIYSQHGCIPIAGCQNGYGMYQNQCINVNGGQLSCQGYCYPGEVQTANGCLPQDGCGPCSGRSYYSGQCVPGNGAGGYGDFPNYGGGTGSTGQCYYSFGVPYCN